MITGSQISQCEKHGAFLRSPKGCPACPSKPIASVPLNSLKTVLMPKTVRTTTGAGAKPRREKQMNQTETRFLHWIKGQCVGRFEFEAVKLRIGENCYYAPDFMLTNLIDEKTTFYEVKGAHIWDDSKVKFKAAKERYPHWSFEMWQWKNGEWKQLF